MKIGILLPIVLLAGCLAEPPPPKTSQQNTSTVEALSAFVLVQDVGGWEGPAVGINGSFAVKDDCLVFETGQVAMTPILPAASRLERTSDGGLAIVLELGGARDTVLLGRSFALAGDVISATAARELSSQVIPDRCPSTVLRTAGVRQ